MANADIGTKIAAGAFTALLLLFGPSASAVAAPGPEPCIDAPVEVTAASRETHTSTCAAARAALQLLARCSILVQKPLQVHIMREVRHPFGGPIFGLFDAAQDRVLVTEYANVASLVEGTPYSALPPLEFYGSLIVHEVVHGVLHQNYGRLPGSHAAYEYPAYALQIEYLPPGVRERFLQAFDQLAMKSNALFNDTILFFDPFFFAARAYQHFKSAPDGCARIRAVLKGEAEFVANP